MPASTGSSSTAKERQSSWRPPAPSVKRMSRSLAAAAPTQDGSLGTLPPGEPWMRRETRRLRPSSRAMSATARYPAHENLSGDSGCTTDQNTCSSTPSTPSSFTARIPASMPLALFTVAPSVTELIGRPTNSRTAPTSST
uniref:Uncharacterized protein n=1 Tax=Triticum urartu TaxID=4572 RepID=A0A8R7TDK9_TRIUA